MNRPGHGMSVRPFPLDSMRTVEKKDVSLINAAARFSAAMGDILELLSGKLRELPGFPASMEVLPLPERFRIDLPAAPERGPCVAAGISCVEKGCRLILLLPVGILSKLLMGLLPSGRLEPPAADPALLEALASMVVLEALAALPPGCGAPRLEAAATAGDFSSLPLRGSFCFFNIKVSLDCGSDILTLLVGSEDLPGMAGGPGPVPRAGRGRVAAGGLEVPVHLVAGMARVPAGQLRGMEAGDVLVPDFLEDVSPGGGPSAVKLVVGRKTGTCAVASCRVGGEGLSVEETFLHHGEKIMTHSDDIRDCDRTELTEAEPRLPEAVSDIPVEVAVEAGRLQLSVGQIASLVQGSIIRLERPLSAEVTLTSGGRTLAYGMLVSVEGEMGVQIIKSLSESSAPSRGR